MAASISVGMLLSPNAASASTSGSTSGVRLKPPKSRVAVHDPSIIKVGNTYYAFGTHITAGKSTDLKNWKVFTNSYTTPGNTLFGNLSKNLAGSFRWAGENDGDAAGGYAVWAPYVLWDKDYVNKDGSTGAYLMYYCVSSTYKRSAIGFAVSKKIQGPYTYVDTILYSGFTKMTNYDAQSDGMITLSRKPNSYSRIDTKYTNTNIEKLIQNGTLSGVNSNWFNSDGSYNTNSFPNAIDPDLFYDKSGNLWMSYGSWSGGIFELQINKKTGEPIYPGKDSSTADGRLIDRYFGTNISGGYGKSGEGSCIIYDKATGYYYLFESYAGLNATGGYNMREFRSKNPDGPFVDAAGQNAVNSAPDNSTYGIKLMGNYQFSCMDVGYRSPGGGVAFIDSDGQAYLVYHTRFDNGTENFELRVHQMFANKDGWLVVAPYEYNGDKISQTGYSLNDLVGTYEFIDHGTSNDGTSMLPRLTVHLNKNGTITGDVKGTWKAFPGTYYVQMVIHGVTYNGVFFKQQDESKFDSEVMTFSAIGNNNESIWGSKEDPLREDQFTAYDLQSQIPKKATYFISLPTSGDFGTIIRWASNRPRVISNLGIVSPQKNDVRVTLTAHILKDGVSLNKSFTVTVPGTSSHS